jgi:thymidine phosphorylase
MGVLDAIALKLLELVAAFAWAVAKLCLRGIRQIGAKRD